MIDQQIFALDLNSLMEHLERKLSPVVMKIWYEELSKHLTTEEWSEAVRQCILNFHPKFKGDFPTANYLLNQVRQSKEAIALIEWQKVVVAAAAGNHDIVERFNARSQIALQAIGGLNKLSLAETSELKWLQKDFVAVYCQTPERDAKTLKPSTTHFTEPAGADNAPMTSEQWDQLRQMVQKLAKKKGMHSGASKEPL